MKTIRDLVTIITSSVEACLAWPPDSFAIAGSILSNTGAYTEVLNSWPPGANPRNTPAENAARWQTKVKAAAATWRRTCLWVPPRPPAFVRQQWSEIEKGLDCNLATFREDSARPGSPENRVCKSLLTLLAIADEACIGVGLSEDWLSSETATDLRFLTSCLGNLLESSGDTRSRGATLTRNVKGQVLRVLPKLRTPQTGLNLRNLSHNLALLRSDELRPGWALAPGGDLEPQGALNILLIPFPWDVRPTDFQPHPYSFDGEFGTFSYRPQKDTKLVASTRELVRKAEDLCGPVHGIIYPELALCDSEFDELISELGDTGAFLLAGTRAEGVTSTQSVNSFRFHANIRFRHLDSPQSVDLEQRKHHRWKLDKSQISQYGLGSVLHPSRSWWEESAFGVRELWFINLRRWLTVSVLICEDLARQEPVAETLRAVGPNLVIALLMDGPQLETRWPARYATVLAEDPGSSVLTLTCAGLCALSRGPDGTAGSRKVALWKDLGGKATEIELRPGSHGIVLNLASQLRCEVAADGRRDDGLTSCPILSGVHYV